MTVSDVPAVPRPRVWFTPKPLGYSFPAFTESKIIPAMICFDEARWEVRVKAASATPQAVRLAPGVSDETIVHILNEIVLELGRGRAFLDVKANLAERLERLSATMLALRTAYQEFSWTLVEKALKDCDYSVPTHVNYRVLLLGLEAEIERMGLFFEPYPGLENDLHHMLVAFIARRMAIPKSFCRHSSAGLLSRIRFYAQMKEGMKWASMPALPAFLEHELAKGNVPQLPQLPQLPSVIRPAVRLLGL